MNAINVSFNYWKPLENPLKAKHSISFRENSLFLFSVKVSGKMASSSSCSWFEDDINVNLLMYLHAHFYNLHVDFGGKQKSIFAVCVSLHTILVILSALFKSIRT